MGSRWRLSTGSRTLSRTCSLSSSTSIVVSGYVHSMSLKASLLCAQCGFSDLTREGTSGGRQRARGGRNVRQRQRPSGLGAQGAPCAQRPPRTKKSHTGNACNTVRAQHTRDLSTNQPIKRSPNQSNHSTDQPINHPSNQPINQTINQTT